MHIHTHIRRAACAAFIVAISAVSAHAASISPSALASLQQQGATVIINQATDSITITAKGATATPTIPTGFSNGCGACTNVGTSQPIGVLIATNIPINAIPAASTANVPVTASASTAQELVAKDKTHIPASAIITAENAANLSPSAGGNTQMVDPATYANNFLAKKQLYGQ